VSVRRPWSLRARLAVAGVAFVLLPLALLLSAVVATTETVEVDEGAGLSTGAAVTTSSPDVSPWVLATAVALALAGSVAAWWWSGRAVQPLGDIAALADQVQEGSLDRRIRLEGAAIEVQALGDSFDRMLDRLEDASSTQRRLVEDTSHELRTPLAALAAAAEVMATTDDPAERRDAEARVARQVARMQRTVDALLADARARQQVLGQVDNDVAAIVRRVVEAQRDATTDMRIDVRGPDALRLPIDGPSVERAVANLVANAARHSPPGGLVQVDVATTADRCDVSVVDSGPGLDPDEADGLFERYRRGAAAGGEDGTGIGLAIVKAVADAYGGVTVASPLTAHGGTRITLHLPGPGTQGSASAPPAGG
jgi:signal transduction histidine kinase